MARTSLDQAALERLFVAHERALFNVVYRWTWDREDAAEIVQEAFGRLWDMRARVDAARARPLVYRIALNLAASRRRWARLRSFVGWDEQRATDAPDTSAIPERDLLARERQEAIAAALQQLPEALRRTVVLCELSELSYEEIAAVLRTRPGTVGSRRHAALARLRPLLSELHEGAGERTRRRRRAVVGAAAAVAAVLALVMLRASPEPAAAPVRAHAALDVGLHPALAVLADAALPTVALRGTSGAVHRRATLDPDVVLYELGP